MVKLLKTWFRNKRDLEIALEVALVKQQETQAKCNLYEVLTNRANATVATLQENGQIQEATIASLQRDLAAAHAKLLIREESPPETLHEAGNGIRKSPVHLSELARDEVYGCWRCGIPIQRIAKDYEISERTVHRIVKEARGRNS